MTGRHDYSATWIEHPWDALGSPPPFGRSYDVVSGVLLDPAFEEEVRRLIRSGEAAYQRADELEEDAHQERDYGDEEFGKARDLIKKEIEPVLPELAAELLKAAYE